MVGGGSRQLFFQGFPRSLQFVVDIIDGRLLIIPAVECVWRKGSGVWPTSALREAADEAEGPLSRREGHEGLYYRRVAATHRLTFLSSRETLGSPNCSCHPPPNLLEN